MLLSYIALLGRILLLGYERIIVKKLGDKSDSISGAFLFFFIGAIFLFPCLFFVSMPESFEYLKFAAISSFIYALAFSFYVKSLSEGEASLVAPLYNINVFFLLILAVAFLDEKFTIYKLSGLILLIYGVSHLNKEKGILSSLKAIIRDKACFYMIIASLFIAIGRTVDGFIVQKIHHVTYAFTLYTGISLFLFLYLLFTNSLNKTVILIKNKPVIAAISGAINAFSYLFLLFAFKKIEVSIAEPASMLGMVVTVFLAGRVFKENIKERIVGVIIMILGSWLLFI